MEVGVRTGGNCELERVAIFERCDMNPDGTPVGIPN